MRRLPRRHEIGPGAPEEARDDLLSAECVDAWSKRADEWALELTPNRKAWWPNFREMFEANGMGAAYEEDYRYLSGAAHGSPWLELGKYMRSETSTIGRSLFGFRCSTRRAITSQQRCAGMCASL